MKNATIVGLIFALLALGGILFYTQNGDSQDTDTTPVSSTEGVATNDSTQDDANSTIPQETASPTVTTDQNSSPTGSTAVVSGTVNPNGNFTTYWYKYGTTVNSTSKTASQTVGSGYISIPAPGYIKGLLTDKTYYFRLVAENILGKVSGDQFVFQTKGNNSPPVGSSPTVKTLAPTGILNTTATLTGDVKPNYATTQYWFEYGKTANLGYTSSFISIGNGSNNLSASASITNLTPSTTYYFRLNAQNQFGTTNGSIISFKTRK